MALTLIAERSGGRRIPYAGERFRIMHSVLLREPGGEQLARHEGLHWYTPETLQLKRMEFIGPLQITFLDKGGSRRHFSPVEQCNVADGHLFIGDRLVAKLDKDGWCIDQDDRCFGQVVFRAAPLS